MKSIDDFLYVGHNGWNIFLNKSVDIEDYRAEWSAVRRWLLRKRYDDAMFVA